MNYQEGDIYTGRTECRQPFTLIELLMVVVVIVILIGILLPALTRAKEISRRAVCSSRLRQQCIAAIMYAEDSDRYWPRGHKYNVGVSIEGSRSLNGATKTHIQREYLNNDPRMWTCPNYLARIQENLTVDGGNSYMLGYFYNGDKPLVNQAFAGYRYPSKEGEEGTLDVPIFSDANTWSSVFPHSFSPHSATGFAGEVDITLDCKSMGAQGGNYGYQDGSVQWLKKDDLSTFRVYAEIARAVYGLMPADMW